MSPNKLSRQDLLSLEQYAEQRDAFRARAVAHKRARTVALGSNMTLLFEDRLTVQYQIQEMLRAERIFESAAIQEELDAYNPLIPERNNLKATLLLEYPDPAQRAIHLAKLRGIEHQLYVRVGELPAIQAIADEDLDRSSDVKTSAVHFIRFQLDDAAVSGIRRGDSIEIGIADSRYPARTTLAPTTRAELVAHVLDEAPEAS
ncbi:DUF3501 domain-containing protein [Ahniella affigens]|uniref:DUF3501 domain-containing protein n=1 Tax=Ahniella affigens TaxID=2021234 RepID=A0A2P1PQD5_9GAMM|nr:DUF3501 family protein [Ahniella affigens]AVP97055.1 DUF3501 domain-containing protein [Ahniella affigens]